MASPARSSGGGDFDGSASVGQSSASVVVSTPPRYYGSSRYTSPFRSSALKQSMVGSDIVALDNKDIDQFELGLSMGEVQHRHVSLQRDFLSLQNEYKTQESFYRKQLDALKRQVREIQTQRNGSSGDLSGSSTPRSYGRSGSGRLSRDLDAILTPTQRSQGTSNAASAASALKEEMELSLGDMSVSNALLIQLRDKNTTIERQAESLRSQAKTADEMATEIRRKAERIRELESQVDKIRQEKLQIDPDKIQKLKEDNRQMIEKISESERKRREQETQIRRLEAELERLQGEADERHLLEEDFGEERQQLRGQIQAKAIEIDSLLSQLRTAKNNASEAEAKLSLERRNSETLTLEITTLKAKVDEERRAKMELETQLEDIRGEQKSVGDQMQHSNSRVEQLENTLRELQSECTKLRERVHEADEIETERQKTIEKLRAESAALRDKHESLQREQLVVIEDLRNENDRLIQLNQEHSENDTESSGLIRVLREECDDLKRRRKELSTEHERQLQTLKDDLQRALNGRREAQTLLQEANQRVRDAERERDAARKSAESERRQRAVAEKERDAIRERVTEAEAQLRDVQSSVGSEKQRTSKAESEIRALRSSLQSARSNSDVLSRSVSQSEIEKGILQAALGDRKGEIDSLEDELRRVKREKDDKGAELNEKVLVIQKLELRIEELLSEQARMNEAVAQFEEAIAAANGHLEQRDGELAVLHEELAAHEKKYELECRHREEARSKFEALEKYLQEQKDDLEDDSERINDLRNTNDELSTKVTELEAQLATTRHECDRWKQRDSDNVERISKAEDRMKALMEECMEVRTELLGANEECRSRSDEIQKLEKELHTASVDIADLQATLAHEREEFNSLRHDFDDVRAKLQSAEEKLKDKTEALGREKDGYEELLEATRIDVIHANQKVLELEGQLADLRVEIESKSEEVMIRNAEIDTRNSRIMTQTDEIRGLNSRIEEMQIQLGELGDEIAAEKAHRERQNKDSTQLQTENAELFAAIQELEHAKHDLEAELKKTNEQADELSARVNECNGEIDELQRANEALEMTRTMNEQTISELREELKTTNEQADELGQRVAECNQEIDDLQRSNEQLEREQKQHTKQITELEGQVQRANSESKNLKDQAKKLAGEIEGLRGKLQDAEKEKLSMEQTISSQSDELKAVNEQADELGARVAECNAEIDSLQRSNESLEKEVASKSTAVETLSTELKNVNEQADELGARVAECNGEIDELQRSNERLEKELAAKSEEASTLSADLQKVNEQADELSLRVNEANAEIDVLDRKLEASTSQNAQDAERIQSLSDTKHYLEGEVQQLDKEKGDAIQTRDQRIADLEAELKQTNEQADDLSARVNEANTEIDGLHRELEQSVEALGKYETEMANASSERTDLNERLAEKQQLTDELESILRQREEEQTSLKDELQRSLARLAELEAAVEVLRADSESKESDIKELLERVRNQSQDTSALSVSLRLWMENFEIENFDKFQGSVCARLNEYQMKLVDISNRFERELKSTYAAANQRRLSELESLESRLFTEKEKSKSLLRQLQDLRGNIRVYCRVRPLLHIELEREKESIEKEVSSVYNMRNPSRLKHAYDNPFLPQFPSDESLAMPLPSAVSAQEVVEARPAHSSRSEQGSSSSSVIKFLQWKEYEFDYVFGPTVSQFDVFRELSDYGDAFVMGYPVCIFAYGQTGAGKTFTMQGAVEDYNSATGITDNSVGLTTRVIEYVFNKIRESEADASERVEWELSVSALEIYNEQLFDVLAGDSTTPMKIHWNSRLGEVEVVGLKKVHCHSVQSAVDVLQIGYSNRRKSESSMKHWSSRSHFVFTLYGQRKRFASNGTVHITNTKLHLIDLAGSERYDMDADISRSPTSYSPGNAYYRGTKLEETCHINSSLLFLREVLSHLRRQSKHIPFRNSKLTFFLQDSLGGSKNTEGGARCAMIINIAPGLTDLKESTNSLTFGSQVREVELGPVRTRTVVRSRVSAVDRLAFQSGSSALSRQH